METQSYAAAFDFSSVIESAREGYLARPAVEQDITDYLGNHRYGCCVVVGEPGGGKSALAAALMHSGGYLSYFLRKGQAEFNLWRDPYSFLTWLGFQLKRRYGDGIFPQTVTIDVQGQIGSIEAGASYTGVQIGRVVAVPRHRTTLRVSTEVERVSGEAISVKIDQFVEEYRRIPLGAYRQMALIDPLLTLQKRDHDASIVLWIDGLDEIAEYSQPGGAPQSLGSIANILPGVEELAELGNLLLVISSRPGPHLDRFITGGAYLVDLGAAKFTADNAAVAGAYIERELAREEVRQGIMRAGRSSDEIRTRLLERGESNFLYLRHFFLAAQEGGVEAVLAGRLPTGLDDIYARLLGRLARDGAERYQREDHLVASLLAVAYRGLTTEQLRLFSGLDLAAVNAAVARLRQFLDMERIAVQNLYSFYHQSFRDCLTNAVHHDEVWYVDPEAAHERIATPYLRMGERGWERLDDYGFDFLTDHLAHGGAECQQRLLRLMERSWLEAKQRHYRSDRSFEADLARAAQSARNLPFSQALAETARLALLQTQLDAAHELLPVEALEVMTALGQLQRALDYLTPGLGSTDAVSRIAGIVSGLQLAGDLENPLVYRLLKEGLERLAADPGGRHADLAILLNPYPARNDSHMAEQLEVARKIFNQLPQSWDTPGAVAELARLWVPIDRRVAEQTFATALEAIVRLTSSNYSIELHYLFRYWIALDPQAVLQQLSQLQLHADYLTAKWLLALGAALEQTGQAGARASWRRQVVDRLLPAMSDPYDLSRSLVELARFEFASGERDQAAATLAQALKTGEKIGTQADELAYLQNRKRYATTLHIVAAALAWECDAAGARQLLQQARGFLREFGCLGRGEIETLVQTQWTASRDVLEAYTETIEDKELKSSLLIATAKQLIGADREAAGWLLEDALTQAPKPRIKMDRNVFAFHLAECLDPGVRRATEIYLQQSGLGPENLVTWRLNVLLQMIEQNDADAEAWLKEAVRYWSEAVTNSHFVCDLPAFVWQVPDALVSVLTRDREMVKSRSHLALLLGALSARLRNSDPETAGALLDESLRYAATVDGEKGIISGRELLAFVAGQHWAVDTPTAEKLWIQALFQLESDQGFEKDYERRAYMLEEMIEQLQRGSRSAALPFLLAFKHPPLPPNSLLFIMPGAGVPEYKVAGMAPRDYFLALALAGELMDRPGGAAEQVRALLPVTTRSLALSKAAREGKGVDIERRVEWCEAAAAAVEQVQPDYLRCLLRADVVRAFASIGVKRKAQDLAFEVAEEALGNTKVWGTLPQTGYAHALGRCLQVIGDVQNKGRVLQLLWRAQVMGTTGLYMILSYLPEIIGRSDQGGLQFLQRAEAEAATLFV